MAFLKGVVQLLLLSSVLTVNCLPTTPYTYSYGMLARPILVDVATQRMYIQDGEWLYHILSFKGAEDVISRVPFYSSKMMSMDKFNYVINTCESCMVLRDVGVSGGIRDWVLDSNRIPFDQTFFNSLKPVASTYGIITDLRDVLGRKTMLNKLGMWDIGMDSYLDKDVLGSKFFNKDISKHVDKVVDTGDSAVHFNKDIYKHISSAGEAHDETYPYAYSSYPYSYSGYPSSYSAYPYSYAGYPHSYSAYPHSYSTYPYSYSAYPHSYSSYPHSYSSYASYPWYKNSMSDVSPAAWSHKSYYPYSAMSYHTNPSSFMPYSMMMMRPKINDELYHDIDTTSGNWWYKYLHGKDSFVKHDDVYNTQWGGIDSNIYEPYLNSKYLAGDVGKVDYLRNILLGGSKPYSSDDWYTMYRRYNM